MHKSVLDYVFDKEGWIMQCSMSQVMMQETSND